MQFHYALVDDLLSKEEFERRVEDKIKEHGDLIDEMTGAMLVVGDLGRQHVKMKGLVAKSSLFCFFARVIGKTEPKEFDRTDGEKGLVASVLVGDETGETRIVLWDEKAMGVEEIDIGDTLEIIGRHGKRPGDIMALALRKASCEIECRSNAGSLSAPAKERVGIVVKLLALEEPRTFTRRDGTPGDMRGAVIGDEKGTARLICWIPELLDGFLPGTTLSVTGALDRSRPPLREYSIDEQSVIEQADVEVDVPCNNIAQVGDEGAYSVTGVLRQILPVKAFTTKDGSRSHVRNLVIGDQTGDIRVVLWGDQAERHFFWGDSISVYNALAKVGRSGERELSIGRGSTFTIRSPDAPGPIEFQGTIIAGGDGTWIDNGTVAYLIEGDHPHGREVRVTGTLSDHTIVPAHVEAVPLDPAPLIERCRELEERAGKGNRH